MSPAISYFIFSSNGSYLRWDDDTNIDFLIRQYQMSITGGGGVDRLYVGAGTKVDAGALFASANTDELYFSGNFSDYAQTISAGGVYTFTGLAGGSHANEVVSFSMNSNGDKLVFANGHITVKSSDYLSVSGSYSSILAGSLTIVAQTDPASGAEPGNKPAKVFVFDAGGINIPQLPIVKEAIAVSGGGGIDKFYVRKGTHADAIGLFASAGQDVLYLTGRFGDYTQTKSAGGVYTFTRNFTGADASLTEVVNFSMNSSGDQLVFADGGVTLRLADYLSGGSYADITAAQLNPLNTTPGLLAPTPNLILASDTGSSASDRITNNATINVTGLVTGGTWQYQMDGTAGSWTTGTASSLIASSGAHTYLVRQFDIAGNSSVVSTAVTYTLDTSPPSGLMVLATSGNVAENTLGAVTLIANANDMPASTSVTWSLGTGLDSALFNITSAGVLSFKTAPNYEMPRGSAFNAASNNDAYTVNVIATDAAGNASAPSAIVVNVSDVNEAPVAVGIISSRAATKNVAFSYDVSRFFSDPDTQASNTAWHTLTYTATGLPSGLTIDDSTGVISGTATAVQVASAITVTASDGGGGSGVTQTFDLEVFNGPVLSDFNVTDSVGNANFGKSGDELTLVVTMSEAVTVTPASDLGIPFSLSMTFSVNGQSTSADYTSGSGSNMLTFTGGSVPVNNGSAISITSIELQRGTVTGNVSMQNWITTHTGQIYAGYTVDNTPPAAPTLMLASDTGISASDSLTNNATILVSGLETTVGTSWQYQVDGTADGSWVTGTGASFTAGSGAHTYLVRQTDAAGNTSAASAPVTYTVDNTAPTVNATTFSVAENTTAVGTLAANETVTWSLGSGADTSRFNLTNGVLSFSVAPDFEMPRGSAFDAASNNNAYTVNVTATDTAGNIKAQAIVVNVTDVNEAPTVIAAIRDQTVVVNQSFSLDVFRVFSDPDSWNRYPSGTPKWGSLTYTATGLPSGLSIAPGESDISGAATATTASEVSVTVTATDGGGLSATTTFNLSVIAVPIAPVVQSFIAKDTVGNPFTGKSGEPMFFVLTMNEPVVVNTHSTPSHAPTIVFSVNGHDVTVTYSAGTGTNILTFTGGTVPTGDGNHITLTTINLNGADVRGTLSNQGWLTTSTGQVHDNYPVDNTAPTVSKTTFSVAENTLDVATGFSRLRSDEAVTWALVTGAGAAADNSFFTLPDSGDLRFTNAPNFEMPRGSAFNAASNNDAYTINVTATDLVGNVGTQVLVVNVTDVNEAPTLTLPARGATSVLLNQAANLNVSGDFSDPDSVNTYAVGTPQWGTLTYTTTGLPAGLSINASTGVISGTATATTASAASVTVTATDGGNMSITETFSLSVVSAPTLSTATPPSTALTGGGNSIGDTIVLTITFDGAVSGLTSGTNNTIFKVAGIGVSATWSGTTGATTRTLTYTVVAGQNGQATLDEVALKTALVAGITNAAGSAFVYSGTIADIDSTALPVIDGTAPTLSSTAPSTTLTGGGDGVGDTIVLTITFDGAVNGLTTGTDDTIFKVAGTGVSATWSGTTGATTRTLTYTVAAGQNGQVTLDEAALKTVLVAGISDAAGNAFVYTANGGTIANIDSPALPVISTVAAAAPTLSAVTSPSTTLNGGGNSIGDTIVLTITFDGAVNGLTSGTNSTIFKVAGTGVSATWSGTTGATTRTLTYTVVAGQNGQATLDEVALKTALVEGITNAAGSAFVYSGTIAAIDSTALPVIDGTAPTLSSTAPSTTLTGGGDGVGDTIVLTITFDGAVNGLTTGTDDTIFKVAGAGVSATWSGTTGATTRTLTYTVAAGQNGQVTLDEAALKTVLVAGISDAAGNAFVYTANSGNIANIDSTPLPVVSTVAAAAPTLAIATPPSTTLTGGGNSIGDTIVLTITFDGAVNGLTSGTNSTIFKVAGTGVSATWSGTTGATTRTLTYTVAAGQNGQATLDEVALKTALAAGITNAAGSAFVYTANGGTIADIDSTALPVIDGTAPTLSTATPPSTTLTGGGDGVGDTIVLTITFDGVVNGLTSGTDDTIFKVAGTGVSATWSGTTGTATRTLTYTVAAGQNGQVTLDEAALKTVLVAGISDAAGNAFVYTANSGNIANIDSTPLPVVSTVAAAAPTLSAVTSPSTTLNGGGNSIGDTIVLTITFDGAVNGLTSGTNSTIFKVAGTGVSATWSGTTGATTRTLTYTVVAGQNGQATLDEVALKTALACGYHQCGRQCVCVHRQRWHYCRYRQYSLAGD